MLLTMNIGSCTCWLGPPRMLTLGSWRSGEQWAVLSRTNPSHRSRVPENGFFVASFKSRNEYVIKVMSQYTVFMAITRVFGCSPIVVRNFAHLGPTTISDILDRDGQTCNINHNYPHGTSEFLAIPGY